MGGKRGDGAFPACFLLVLYGKGGGQLGFSCARRDAMKYYSAGFRDEVLLCALRPPAAQGTSPLRIPSRSRGFLGVESIEGAYPKRKSARRVPALIYGRSRRADVFMLAVSYTVTAERYAHNKDRP